MIYAVKQYPEEDVRRALGERIGLTEQQVQASSSIWLNLLQTGQVCSVLHIHYISHSCWCTTRRIVWHVKEFPSAVYRLGHKN